MRALQSLCILQGNQFPIVLPILQPWLEYSDLWKDTSQPVVLCRTCELAFSVPAVSGKRAAAPFLAHVI